MVVRFSVWVVVGPTVPESCANARGDASRSESATREAEMNMLD